MAEKVTIATVARLAQVSRQTVSNVINAPHIVREETRRRVEQAIADLGYRANQAARQMRTGRSRLVAVRVEPTRDGINGWVLDRFLHGLTEAAATHGYRVMLYTAEGHKDEIGTFEDLLAAYDLDAFVLHGTDHGDPRPQWLTERGVPFVTFGRPWDAPTDRSWVDVDGAAGTGQVTRRLIDAGHRRIAFIGWPSGSGTGDDRRAGWSRELTAAGLPTDLDARTQDGVDQCEACAAELLAGDDPPTALVCASDSLAVGALRAAAPHAGAADAHGGAADAHGGAATARGVAVAGFDDTPVAQAVGLTSVSQPLPEAAARCMEMLIHLLDGDSAGAQAPVLLVPSLVIRRTA
jgi:DNA-binding LacI/PurR family transcriptional regulator